MKISTLLFSVFFCLHVAGQASEFRLIPGVSAGPVKLGMTEAQVHQILKGNYKVSNYGQELIDFVGGSSNYHLDSIPQFVIGFDKSLTAQDNALENSPVFNMYFMKDKLVYIGITSYSISDEMKKSVIMKDSIRFGMFFEDCHPQIGDDFMPVTYGTYSGDHVYYKDGFEMTYDENILTFIAIFSKDLNYPKKLALNSRRLKAEQIKAEKSKD